LEWYKIHVVFWLQMYHVVFSLHTQRDVLYQGKITKGKVQDRNCILSYVRFIHGFHHSLFPLDPHNSAILLWCLSPTYFISPSKFKILCLLNSIMCSSHRHILCKYHDKPVAQLVSYKPEGCGLDSWWCNSLNLYRCIMALRSTQSLTEVSTKNISWWCRRPVHFAICEPQLPETLRSWQRLLYILQWQIRNG
jgi:hypothetical protein